MKRLLLIVVAACVCGSAGAIFTIETPEGKIWVWQEPEMDALKRDMTRLILERDAWKLKAEAPRECV